MLYFVRVLVITLLPSAIDANGNFLEPAELDQKLTLAQDREMLHAIEELISAEHREATERRLAPLEALLMPTLAAMPKNEHGRYGHKSARYALHRLFVQRHAWFVKGVELDGDWGNAAPLKMLEGNVPEILQNRFEDRLGSHGLTSHDIAVVAATLENLAHVEAIERLEAVYKFLGVDFASHSTEQADSLLDTYMAVYITDLNIAELKNRGISPEGVLEAAEQAYPEWAEVVPFVRRMRKEALGDAYRYSFANMTDVVALIGEKYGRWQAEECVDLKKKLFAIEDDGTGRVSLTKFYDHALNHGQWQFSESASYLRSLGALDESKPLKPRVIVTNYILAPANCVASSKYYSVCCHDGCEDLLSNFEREIRAPVAEPARIAEIAKLNGTERARQQLRLRLDEIAADNGGFVPLHGRLFAQWMHHAYPRECPYPHLSGTTRPTRPETYFAETGLDSGATEDEMMQYKEVYASREEEEGHEQDLVWSSEDELFVDRHVVVQVETPDRLSTSRTVLRLVALCVPAVSIVMFLLREGRTATAAVQGGSSQVKFHV